MIKTLLLAAGLWTANVDSPARQMLDRAHHAFLEKNYLAMTGAIRDVLANNEADSTMRANAFALLSAAYAETGGRLPADWQAPRGLTKMRFHLTRRNEPDRVFYRARLRADMPKKDSVTQVQLVRYPNEVVLDKKAGLGEWEVEEAVDSDVHHFGIESSTAMPLADGLYLIRFEMNGGERNEGWFILSELASSESPVIDRPAAGATVQGGRPEIVWRDFHSPESKPYERRGMNVNVVRIDENNKGWDIRWGLYTDASPNTRAVVGSEPLAEIDKAPLEPGRYWLTVEYQEGRQFGPMSLRRLSRSGRPFYVSEAPSPVK